MTVPLFITFLLTLALLGAGSAAVAGVEDARRIVDRAEPLRCEIIALQERLRQAPVGSEEFADVSAELDRASLRLQSHLQANWAEFAAAMSGLTAEEKEKVDQYASAMADRCVAKACGGAPCPPRAPAGNAEPPLPQRPVAKAPYVPPPEKDAPGAARGNPWIQKRAP